MICTCGKVADGYEDYAVWHLGVERQTDPLDLDVCCRLSRHRDYRDRATTEYRTVGKPTELGILYGVFKVTRFDGHLPQGYVITDARGQQNRVTPGGMDFIQELRDEVTKCLDALSKPLIKVVFDHKNSVWILEAEVNDEL